MASEVGIANEALLHLGETASIASFSENSFQAELCKRFYPTTRDSLLEMFPWSFSLKRARPALIESTINQWSYSFSLPADCIRILSVIDGDADDFSGFGSIYKKTTVDYVTENLPSGVIGFYTNCSEPNIRYISRVIDPNKFTPLFCSCLSRYLASKLAGPLIKGDAGRAEAKGQFEAFQIEYQRAVAADSKSRNITMNKYSPYLSVR